MFRDLLDRVAPILFVALLLGAAVGPYAVGTASAETYVEQVDTTGVTWVTVDLSDVNGEVELVFTVSGDEIPGKVADQVVRRVTVGEGYAIQNFAFRNADAYDSIEVRAELLNGASGTAYIDTGKGDSLIQPIGSTEGDADLVCEFPEGYSGSHSTDCNPLPTQAYNETALDANETKAQIHGQGAGIEVTNNHGETRWKNTLEYLKNDAIIEGKLAYVRALENGSTESVARSRAKEAVRDYWTKRQMTLKQRWNSTVLQVDYLAGLARNQSGVDENYVTFTIEESSWPGHSGQDYGERGFRNATDVKNVTYVNGSVGKTLVITGDDNYISDMDFSVDFFGEATDSNSNTYHGDHLIVRPGPNTDSRAVMAEQEEFPHRWSTIQNASVETVDQVDTFANNTYEDYASGDINATDILNAYDYAAMGPGDGFQTWALSELSRIGVAGPSTLQSTGHMVVWDNTTQANYTGILVSDGLPTNDTFEKGVTYYASNLTGPQFVVTENTTHELTGEFRIEHAETYDGENLTQVAYTNVSYETVDLSDLKSLYQNLSNVSAEIESRQELLYGSGSGGGGSGSGFSGEEVAIGAAALAGLAIWANQAQNGNGGDRRGRGR